MTLRRAIAMLVLAAAAGTGASSAAEDTIRSFDLAVVNGAVAPASRVLKVPHQADVGITWTVDRPMTIHLEGYNISVFARPDAPQTMRFKAYATGRFPVHAHEGDKGEAKSHGHGRGALLRVEVHPR
ncbi:MAG: hypothetical protein FJ311_08540 [Rhodospirillales bacterium]|nr:hypothetical protein [Rhodospirillales bacterium]